MSRMSVAAEPDAETTAARRVDGPSAIALTVAAALIVFVVVAALTSWEMTRAPASLVLALGLLLLIPSSPWLSRRLALNGAILLGAIPVLWWLALPAWVPVGRTSLVLAGAAACVVVLYRRARPTRRSIVGMARRADAVLPVAALFALWFFWPLLTAPAGSSSVAMLVQGFGGDNVGHFDMFAMIREWGVTGHAWPTPLDGSTFAYTVYPQHFHAITAAIAEAWFGSAPGGIATETQAYLASTAVVLALALLTVVAAVASTTAMRGRFGPVFIVATAIVTFVLLGFGASGLAHGFPGYLLAVIGTVLAIVLAASPRPRSTAELLAVCATVVLVAHSWMLLAPVAAVGLLAVLVAARRHLIGTGRASLVRMAIVAATFAAGVFGGVLVLLATTEAGGPAAALSTPGGADVPSIPLTIALGVAVITVCFALALPIGAAGDPKRTPRALVIVAGIAATVGLLEGALLAGVQYSQASQLSYFQYKYINAMTILFAVLAIFVAAACCVRAFDRPPRARLGWSVVIIAGLSLSVVTSSGLPTTGSTAYPGLSFRAGLSTAVAAPDPEIERLAAAATILRQLPCPRPWYYSTLPSILAVDMSNQWAMSLSATWTEHGSAITRQLFTPPPPEDRPAVAALITRVLESDPSSCVVIEPGLYGELAELRSEQGDRVLTW